MNDFDESKEKIEIKDEIFDGGAIIGKKLDRATKISMEIYDWINIIVVFLSIFILVFTFIGRMAVVNGPSMMNTLEDSETLLISNFLYTPKQNDIVVFQKPDSDYYSEPIVKRVIATAGQTVDIDFDTWTVTVDGVKLNETYVNYIPGMQMNRGDGSYPYTVKANEVFVMGDNRNNSVDSRFSVIGPVDVRYIIGEVKCRIFPLSKFGGV